MSVPATFCCLLHRASLRSRVRRRPSHIVSRPIAALADLVQIVWFDITRKHRCSWRDVTLRNESASISELGSAVHSLTSSFDPQENYGAAALAGFTIWCQAPKSEFTIWCLTPKSERASPHRNRRSNSMHMIFLGIRTIRSLTLPSPTYKLTPIATPRTPRSHLLA